MSDRENLPLDAQRRNLGEQRLDAFVRANAVLQFNALTLNMSVLTAPQAGYRDAALQAIATDARDLRDAADALATLAEQLAGHWRAQRQEATP